MGESDSLDISFKMEAHREVLVPHFPHPLDSQNFKTEYTPKKVSMNFHASCSFLLPNELDPGKIALTIRDQIADEYVKTIQASKSGFSGFGFDPDLFTPIPNNEELDSSFKSLAKLTNHPDLYEYFRDNNKEAVKTLFHSTQKFREARLRYHPDKGENHEVSVEFIKSLSHLEKWLND